MYLVRSSLHSSTVAVFFYDNDQIGDIPSNNLKVPSDQNRVVSIFELLLTNLFDFLKNINIILYIVIFIVDLKEAYASGSRQQTVDAGASTASSEPVSVPVERNHQDLVNAYKVKCLK